MTLAPATHYKADLRAIRFTLYDHLKVDRLFALKKFVHLSPRRVVTDRNHCA